MLLTIKIFPSAPSQGPVTLLQSCHSEGVRVQVWIRHCAGVRGVCEGMVTAFDKHFNLVSGLLLSITW